MRNNRHPTTPALLLLALLITLSACDQGPVLKRLDSEAILLAFGDSLTYGSGVGSDDSYPSVLQQRIHLSVINGGVPGELSGQGLARLADVLETHQPDLVILCHGGNDILRRHDPEQTKANLKAMIEQIDRRGAQVILLAVPQFGIIPSAAPFYAELAEELGINVELDIVPRLERSPQYKSDAIHFNREGYARMAQAVEQLLRERGAL